MGHIHVVVRDMEVAKKIWIGHFGGTPLQVDGEEAVRLPGILVFLSPGSPSGTGSEGTAVNHIGFFLTNSRGFLAEWKAAGFKVTFNAGSDDHGYIFTAEGLRIEIQTNHFLKSDDPPQATPVVTDHIHFNGPAAYEKEAQVWYVKRFGAKSVLENEGDIPGIRLRFAVLKSPNGPTPTKGKTLDHVGFEVKNLEQFCKKLEATGVSFDQPYSKTRHKSFGSAEFTDPWGATIELTEGLDRF